MVSPLWSACDEGDLNQVQLLLKDISPQDLEIKDNAGATPLVLAVKKAHVDIVRALLDAGADHTVTFNEESLEQLTADATLIELLNATKERRSQAESPATTYNPPENYSQDYTTDPSKAYYAQPPASYMYYPVPSGIAMLPDGTPAPYYPPPPPPPPSGHPHSDGNGGSNLPPPEIARLIPCRYFPACRYGPACIFAHPQGPYFQGPLPPPAQYPTSYDSVSQPPYPGPFYAVPQTPYPPPNGISSPANPSAVSQSPVLQPNQGRGDQGIVSPVQGPYNPNAIPLPIPYALPMPAAYPQPNQMSLPPIPVGMPPLPPAQQGLPPAGQPNGMIYPPQSPVVQVHNQGMIHRRDSSIANIPNGIPPQVGPDGVVSHQPTSPQDGYGPPSRQQPRDGMNHGRRGSMRRGSMMSGNRKPPCLFFPSGRCRNGDQCRFPHVLPDANDPSQTQQPSKYGSRSRPANGPTPDSLAEKVASLNMRADGVSEAPQPNGHVHGLPLHPNGNPRAHSNYKANYVNGTRSDKRNATPRSSPPQRIPNAEDFPVLAGSVTPPSRSPGAVSLNGPTAAQVLQAPPPLRKDSGKTPAQSVKGDDTAPVEQESQPQQISEDNSIKEASGNGHIPNGNGIEGSHDIEFSKSVSFSVVAAGAGSAGPEQVNTVSVSA